ncbi:hypothetical protein EDB81DRAFT_807200, partial [Dactylonectria macrodidyma]
PFSCPFFLKFCLHSSSLSCRPLPPSFVPVGALNNQASSTHHPASSISSPSTNKPPLKSPILVPYPPPHNSCKSHHGAYGWALPGMGYTSSNPSETETACAFSQSRLDAAIGVHIVNPARDRSSFAHLHSPD